DVRRAQHALHRSAASLAGRDSARRRARLQGDRYRAGPARLRHESLLRPGRRGSRCLRRSTHQLRLDGSTQMKLLITGGAGFIGSTFIRFALQRLDPTKVVNVDKLTYAGNLENLAAVAQDARYRFVQADVCDGPTIDALFAEVRPDIVVHFAAESH